ncbi:RDD family protein [Hymenobacter lutimineralis]|uniref:RDD family protein n=1 Tax=Hymenobacter lutimineralis TaxID=2606448 RepID=A0A5D6UYQ3_9BACT|nr:MULTISPECIES: RDD family protein [Hymenobacter]QIX60656.1 RDD family protein [Hymenobacter sp. BT18]TYZ08703.1 RDD family protein [Hymenobacter lutimineralis]
MTSSVTPDFPEYPEIAGQGRRLANYLIDLACVFLLAAQFGIILVLVGKESWLDDLDNPLLDRLVTVILLFFYYLFFEALFGRTVGKMVTGTTVVMEDGTRPPFSATLKRTLWRIVPFEPLSFLGSAQGWHDTKSGTMVVRIPRK